MNRITIIGRLTADPNLQTTANGVKVCRFKVAVNRRFQNDEVDFFPVSVWRDAGMNCNKYLGKGSRVCVTGELQTRTYEQDGVTKHYIDIIADEVEFLSFIDNSEEKKPKSLNELKKVIIEQGNMPF